MTLKTGTKLGQYTIQKKIGSGGMGDVYLAFDTALKRSVAIKKLLPMHADDPDLVRRFELEAQAVAQLNHPNIVQLFQVDVQSDPMYMAMEFVDGIPLDLLVKQNEKLSWQQALSIGGQVAAALACTHERGIIHRDIKPANILLDKNMRVHVTDFGIARILAANTRLTATDAAIGTPSYMSPEHCDIGEIVPVSDIFSLGVTLFEAMAGELPFKADTILGLMNQITSEPPSSITEIVPVLLDSMMGKDLDKRYTSASQIIEDLRAFRDGKTPTHLSAIRKKQSGTKGTIFEVVVPEKNIMKASQGQSLVQEFMTDQENTIVPAHIIHKPDSNWPTYILRGAIATVSVAILVLIFVGFTRMEVPKSNNTAPGPPPARTDEPPPQDIQIPINRLPIDPDGQHRLPYEGWKPRDPLPEGWFGPDGRAPGSHPDGPPPGGRRPPPRPGQ